MPRRKLTRGMLLTEGNEKTLEEVMKMPRDEKFVCTLLYNRLTYNMYVEAYKYRHSIRNDEDLPEYLRELIKIYELFDICTDHLPDDIQKVYHKLFERYDSLQYVSYGMSYSKTSIHRFKKMIIKSLVNCLNI